MNSLIDLNISRMKNYMLCGASAREEIKIGFGGPAALLGNAVHALLHQAVQIYINRPHDGIHLPPHAAEIIQEENPGSDPKEAFILASYGIQFLNQILSEGAEILGVEMEVSYEWGGYRVIGHLDLLLKLADGTMAVVDYKTGDPDGSNDYHDQCKGYLMGVLDEGQGGRYFVVWLKNQTVTTEPVSWEALTRWQDKLFLSLQRKTFNPGDHCFFCPVKFSCPAQEQLNRSTVSSLLPLASDFEGERALMTPERLASIWNQSRQVKKALEEYETMIGLALREAGEIPLPDGRFLRFTRMEWEEIEPSRKAVETLGKLMGRDPLEVLELYPGAFEISKKPFMDALAQAAPKGKGQVKLAIESAMDTMREAGILRTVRREYPKAYKESEKEESGNGEKAE